MPYACTCQLLELAAYDLAGQRHRRRLRHERGDHDAPGCAFGRVCAAMHAVAGTDRSAMAVPAQPAACLDVQHGLYGYGLCSYKVMAYKVRACIVYIVVAYGVMAYVVMAYLATLNIAMVYILIIH